MFVIFDTILAAVAGAPPTRQHSEEGRCGPLFDGAKCDCSKASWAVYCNSATGWCGDTAEHANADGLTTYDCPTSPLRAAATGVATDRTSLETPMLAVKSNATDRTKEKELFNWLRDKAGLSQQVIDKAKAKLSDEDVDSVDALQALHKLGGLGDVFSRVPAQQVADALSAAAGGEVKKNPWETGEPGHWDTNGQWISDASGPKSAAGAPGAKKNPWETGEPGHWDTNGQWISDAPNRKGAKAAEGRCGPLFNGTRCDCSQASWAVYCNAANGWCGDSAEHANADDHTEYDCPHQVQLSKAAAEGRCGPLFNGTRCDCSRDITFVFCNAGNGWCGNTAEHAHSDNYSEYDCLSSEDAAAAAAAARVAQETTQLEERQASSAPAGDKQQAGDEQEDPFQGWWEDLREERYTAGTRRTREMSRRQSVLRE